MRSRARLFLVFACMLLLTAFIPARGAVPRLPLDQGANPVFVGAGDIAQCGVKRDEATAALVESIDGTVFTLGDNAYPRGTLDEFKTCYETSWGRFKDRTIPVVGNHEYKTEGAEGHFTYFGVASSPLDLLCTRDCKGYYSFNLGAWHIIVLNSGIDMQAGSDQEQWLRFDLATNRTACTLAMWHRPLFSSGRYQGEGEDILPLWQALYEYQADLVLNGHEHNYQRFAPQNPDGQADPKGIRQIIVGTGGAELYRLNKEADNLEVRDDKSYGVLKLTLYPESYDWQFIPIPNDTFTDLGGGTCVTSNQEARLIGTATPAPTPTPTPPPTLTPTAAPFAPSGGGGESAFEAIIRWLKRLFGEP